MTTGVGFGISCFRHLFSTFDYIFDRLVQDGSGPIALQKFGSQSGSADTANGGAKYRCRTSRTHLFFGFQE